MKKILIVEDNELNLDMLCRRLQRNGFAIEAAHNGKEAIIKTMTCPDKYRPDLILMDMSLPIMDGWEATYYLKSHHDTCHIPIIGLSAHARDADIIKGRNAGCDAYQTKPVNFPKLLSAIAELLE